MRHRLPGALLLALLAVSVSSCSDDPEPDIADPTSNTPTPSSIAPTSEPPTSSETTPPERETVQEFIRRYARAEAEMENTGEVDEYLEFTDSCESCEALAKTVAGYYRNGGSVRWGGWKIRKIARHNGSPNDFAVTVDTPPTTYRERADGPRKQIKGGRVTYVVTLVADGESWLVGETAQLAS